jgi:hypothetical protein
MMNGYGSWGGSFALMHFFGGLLGICFLVGIVFFLAWAIKTLKKDQLLHWSILLVAVAAIGCILAVSLGGWGQWKSGSGFRGGPGMMWGSYDSDGK